MKKLIQSEEDIVSVGFSVASQCFGSITIDNRY